MALAVEVEAEQAPEMALDPEMALEPAVELERAVRGRESRSAA